jgi:hypothetical protein
VAAAEQGVERDGRWRARALTPRRWTDHPMQLTKLACLLLLVGCAGPGTVLAVDGASGLVFRFVEGETPGIDLGPMEVLEIENGERSRTLCRLSGGPKVIEWVYGSDLPDGRYWQGPCPKLEANRLYGIIAVRPDRRVVTTRFLLDEHGHVHDYGRR